MKLFVFTVAFIVTPGLLDMALIVYLMLIWLQLLSIVLRRLL